MTGKSRTLSRSNKDRWLILQYHCAVRDVCDGRHVRLLAYLDDPRRARFEERALVASYQMPTE